MEVRGEFECAAEVVAEWAGEVDNQCSSLSVVGGRSRWICGATGGVLDATLETSLSSIITPGGSDKEFDRCLPKLSCRPCWPGVPIYDPCGDAY